MLTVTFDELEQALRSSEATAGAAEAHGLLCGAIAGAPYLDPDRWVGEVVPGGADAEVTFRTRDLLSTLVDETAAAFAGEEMEFEPLLPDDAEPLERRTDALAAWCGGYLYGLGAGLPSSGAAAWPEPVQEVVRDFGEISKASVGTEEPEETNEASYVEIVEYVRAAAQLVFEELRAHREREGTHAEG